jgi:RNA polymerase sigma-54 factor
MLQAPYLRQAPSLRPLTTAHLAQTMSLLELPAEELNQKIEAELARNPALELRENKRCPTCKQPLSGTRPCQRCSTPKSLSPDEPIIFISPREDFFIPGRLSADELPEDNFTPDYEDLPTYVLKQIAPDLDHQGAQIAAHLLTNLDDNGLLNIPISEVAQYHHIPLSKVKNILYQIQRSEPLGVGSPSPKEALLVQLDVLSESRSVPSLARIVISEGMELLSKHQYAELGRLVGTSTRNAKDIATFISENLNPYPAHSAWGDVRQASQKNTDVFTHPDVIVNLLTDSPNSPLVVEIVSPFAGLLQVNNLFRNSLSQAPPDKADQWRSDLDRAELLVKCLQQRTNTIVRLMKRITTLQRDFILLGDRYLKPVTRASLANVLEVHESTISRAVSSKTVQLPNGHIVPLSKFFDRSLHIRTALKQIIHQETKPLSDNEITKVLETQGFKVARRTVAKYRAMEGILPSHLRQNQLVSEVT